MKPKFFILFFIIFFQLNYSQNTVKMITEYGTKNNDLTSLMNFQNIELFKLSFESPEIIGKNYEVNIKEYKNGKLIKTKNLIDLALVDYLKIDTSHISFSFFSKIEDDKLTVHVKSERMSSSNEVFKLKKGNGKNYVLKDFQGIEEFTNVPINEEFSVLTVITPINKGNGISSYCDVAYSGFSSESYWEKFKIPHYFVITMKFK